MDTTLRDRIKTSWFRLVSAIRRVYNFSFLHAAVLSAVVVLPPATGPHCLAALDALGNLDHDASIAHLDLPADVNICPIEVIMERKYHSLTHPKDGKALMFHNLAEARPKCEEIIAQPLDDFTTTIA